MTLHKVRNYSRMYFVKFSVLRKKFQLKLVYVKMHILCHASIFLTMIRFWANWSSSSRP